MRVTFSEHLRSFRRSWIHHTGMQLATLSVLAATFTVVAFVLTVSLNLKRLLTQWGESVQMSVYLEDSISNENRDKLKAVLEKDTRFKSVKFVPKEEATSIFKDQMASYAPDLLDDAEFANPFPASYQINLDEKVSGSALATTMETVAQKLSSMAGVENVSYGQGWVKNYSSFVAALSATGWLIVAILIAGSLFVVGNSIRASIAARRDEIEILELVGATTRMIRAPLIFEGALMGLIAAVVSLAANYALFLWEVNLLQSTLAFTRLVPALSFFTVVGGILLLAAGAGIGAFGAYATVRQINDGWSASQRHEA